MYKSPLLHRVRPNIRKPVIRVPSESEKEVPTIPLLASNRTICKAARRIDHTAWSLEGHQPSCKQGPCCDPTNIQQSWSADKQNQSEGHINIKLPVSIKCKGRIRGRRGFGCASPLPTHPLHPLGRPCASSEPWWWRPPSQQCVPLRTSLWHPQRNSRSCNHQHRSDKSRGVSGVYTE